MILKTRMTRRLATAAAVAALSPFMFAGGASAQTKLNIGISVHSLFGLPVYVAHHMGAYKEEGLDVTLTEFTGGATATPALLGGSVALQAAGTENLLKLQQRGQAITAVMSIQSTLNGAILLRKDLADKLGRKPTLADIKGLRVATLARGGFADVAMRYLVDEMKLVADKDVILVPVLGYDKQLAALQAKDIDASMVVEPIPTFWSRPPINAVYMVDFMRGEGPELFQDMNWVTLQGKKEWIDANKETVRKVVRATVKAQNLIVDPANLDKVTDLAAKSFPEIPREVLKISIQNQLRTYPPQITEAGIKKNNDLLLKANELKAAIPYAQAVDSSYSDLWKAYTPK